MTNIFENVLSNLSQVEEQILGPDYNYWKKVKSPTQMGMSSKGTLGALEKDIKGTINYVKLLITGQGNASTVGGPLGNKFFMKTGGTCADIQTKKDVDRYIYINNVPDGSIPFITQGMGTTFTAFEGLVPGALGDLNAINPMGLLQSFMLGSKPDCQAITMEVIDPNDNSSQEAHYVTTVDIQNMNPCWFLDKRNPVSGVACSEGFSNRSVERSNKEKKMPDPLMIQLYYSSLGLLGLYILFRLVQGNK